MALKATSLSIVRKLMLLFPHASRFDIKIFQCYFAESPAPNNKSFDNVKFDYKRHFKLCLKFSVIPQLN